MKIGSFGDLVCFSFDGIKNITAGEGGAIVTGSDSDAQMLKDARLLGVEKDTENRFAGKRSWKFDVRAQGWRFHMSNIMAAIGIAQLSGLASKGRKRKKLAVLYDRLLAGQNQICRIDHDYDQVLPHIYVVRIEGLQNRDRLREKLLSYGIETGVHYQPNHVLKLYNKCGSDLALPVTDRIYSEILSLPLHPDLLEDDVRFVCQKLIENI